MPAGERRSGGRFSTRLRSSGGFTVIAEMNSHHRRILWFSTSLMQLAYQFKLQ